MWADYVVHSETRGFNVLPAVSPPLVVSPLFSSPLLIFFSSLLFHPLISPLVSTSHLHISSIISRPLCLFSTLVLCFPRSPGSRLCSSSLHLLSTYLIFYLLLSSSNLFCLCLLWPCPLISSPLSSFPMLLSPLLTSFAIHGDFFPPLLADFLTARNEE